MPELPDVEVFRRYFDDTSLHQEIESVEVHSRQVLSGITPEDLEMRLKGRSFESTQRHGKHLFARLDDGGWLGLHFGMTGSLKYFKRPTKEPEYEQVRFDFSNDYHLAYDIPRKLGEIRVIQKLDSFMEAKDLGPDALDLSFERFRQALSGRRAMVKSALMNQSIIAGIGNVYSDEILFQARIHPREKVNELPEAGLRKIFDCMKEVLHTAIECQADPDQFPDSYIIPRRDEGAACPSCDGEVKRIKVSGRSGYFCPQCQRQGEQE